MGGLSPTEQSFLFKMVYGLLPNKTKLMRFGLDESDQCFFCNEKDDKDHPLFGLPSSLWHGGGNEGHIQGVKP